VECDFSSSERNDETFDPAKSVIATSQKTEDISSGAVAAGIPGTASTLPRPAARPASGANTVTRRTENVSYQSSHTVRHVREPQGAIKRVSVSLLVDSGVRYEGSGLKTRRIVEPPSAAKLKTIHDLVAGVIGFSAERGDQLVVETLPFESTLNPEQFVPAKSIEPVAAPPGWRQQIVGNRLFLIGAGVAVAILLALAFLVIRMTRRKTGDASGVEMPGELAAAPGPDQLQAQIENRLAEQSALRQRNDLDALNSLKLPPVTKKAEVLTKHISEQAKNDSSSMAHVLRAWMADPGDQTKR